MNMCIIVARRGDKDLPLNLLTKGVDAMRTAKFAIVLFLFMLMFCMNTPAIAQFGPTAQLYVFTPEISSDGAVALRVYTTQCVQNAQIFFQLSKLEKGAWQDLPIPLIPIGIEPMTAAVTIRRNLNLRLPSGTYKLSVDRSSEYGNTNRNVNESRYCASGVTYYSLKDNVTFMVGNQSEAPTDTPILMEGDQYTALKERVVRFGALFPNPTRLIFSQTDKLGKVNYFISDQPATAGEFQQFSVGLPKNFNSTLSVEVNAQDKVTGMSTSIQILKPDPILTTTK